MDAGETGIGYVVPMPRFLHSHIGDVAYIDEDGVVRTTGNVFEDAHFKELLACSQSALDRTNSNYTGVCGSYICVYYWLR